MVWKGRPKSNGTLILDLPNGFGISKRTNSGNFENRDKDVKRKSKEYFKDSVWSESQGRSRFREGRNIGTRTRTDLDLNE